MSLLLSAMFKHGDVHLKAGLSPILSPSSLPPPPPTDTTRPGFSLGTALAIAILVCAFLFMGFTSIYIRRCSDSRATALAQALPIARPHFSSASTFGGCQHVHQARLHRAMVEKLPILSYATLKGRKMGKAETECSVCLGEFDAGCSLRLLPKCEHAFHPQCIDLWLASHWTCPVCRTNLLPEEP